LKKKKKKKKKIPESSVGKLDPRDILRWKWLLVAYNGGDCY
jgi:hypothetical protein